MTNCFTAAQHRALQALLPDELEAVRDLVRRDGDGWRTHFSSATGVAVLLGVAQHRVLAWLAFGAGSREVAEAAGAILSSAISQGAWSIVRESSEAMRAALAVAQKR